MRKLTKHIGLALMGWYLMMPPQGYSTVPISGKWQIQGSYDSAHECERNMLQEQLWGAKTAADEVTDPTERKDFKELAVAQNAAIQAARCIATNDPRLGR